MLNLGAIIFGFLFGVLIGSQIKTKSMDIQFTLASFVIIFIVGLVSAWQLGPFPFYTDMPIASGFFFAFTVSMDDFVVTYFTKGAGINTISTMLYQQLRRGINPQMYALSTLLFLTILILLGLINHMSATKQKKADREEDR